MNVTIKKNEVLKISNSIIANAEDFESNIKKLLNIIEGINLAWEGADALKYINTLKDKYIVELNGLVDVINQYGEYLKNVPEAYMLLDEAFSCKNIDV
jgi:hypothetical protein